MAIYNGISKMDIYVIKTRFYIPIVHKVGFPQSSVSKETPALQRIWVQF